MKNMRFGLLAACILGAAGTFLVSSTFAGPRTYNGLQVVRPSKPISVSRSTVARNYGVRPSSVSSEADQSIRLIPPPSELPKINSKSMVTSVKAFAPVAPKRIASRKNRARVAAKQTNVQPVSSMAKPQNLYSYVRLLNYAPHPLREDIFKKTPLALGANKYWFSVKYDEDWKVLNDEEGYIKGISFEIDVMENNRKVRSLKTPKVKLNSKKIQKGQVLGIAEVAPYRFTIKVEDFKKMRKGISELVFKLDLVG
jgi:hypothetical protein